MSYVDKMQSVGSSYSNARTIARGLGALLFLLVAGSLLAIGLSGAGAAASADFLESNVTQQSDDEPLEIEVSYSDEFGTDDTDAEITSADATVEFYNSTEYENDSDVATALHSATITGNEGQTITQSYDFGDIDALSYGEDYTVVVTGDDTQIDDAARVDGLLGGGTGGSVDSVPGFGVGAGVAAIAVAAAALIAGRRS